MAWIVGTIFLLECCRPGASLVTVIVRPVLIGINYTDGLLISLLIYMSGAPNWRWNFILQNIILVNCRLKNNYPLESSI